MLIFVFRKVVLDGVELKPLERGEEINFVDVDPQLKVNEKRSVHLGPHEFWDSLPIMEGGKLF